MGNVDIENGISLYFKVLRVMFFCSSKKRIFRISIFVVVVDIESGISNYFSVLGMMGASRILGVFFSKDNGVYLQNSSSEVLS